MVCKIGDGKGSGNSEKLIGVSFTIQECVDTVKQQHPTANGATMSNPCPNKCACSSTNRASNRVVIVAILIRVSKSCCRRDFLIEFDG